MNLAQVPGKLPYRTKWNFSAGFRNPLLAGRRKL
jgi:hypothetical protein